MDKISNKWMKMADNTATKKETLDSLSEKQSEVRKLIVKLDDFVTDEKFEKYIRKHTPEEFDALSKAIAHDGKIRDPLTVVKVEGDDRKCIVIDGHHRLKIAKKLVDNGRFEFGQLAVNIETFVNDQEIYIWMLRHQLGRRNLTPFERAEIGFRITTFLEDLALDKKKHKEIDIKLLSIWIKAPETDKIDYAEVVSELTGVPRTTIIRAKKVHQKADDTLKFAIRAGDISISKAYEQLVEKEKQEKKVQKVKKRIDNFSTSPLSIKELETCIASVSLDKVTPIKIQLGTKVSLIKESKQELMYVVNDQENLVYVKVLYDCLENEKTPTHYTVYILSEGNHIETPQDAALVVVNPKGKTKIIRNSTVGKTLTELEELKLLRNVIQSF